MSDVRVRPFRRADRDQLTQLINAHAEAVVPGMSVSVNTVLSSLERQPGERSAGCWPRPATPGLPARRGLPRADPDRARLDPGVSMR